jgi:peptidoglycan L-alanyl-D-glutamate endopeptidase CwlK
MSRRIEDLHPVIQNKAIEVKRRAKEELDIDINIYFTNRTVEEQDGIYAQGRTKPGPKVTNAPGGYSFHNSGLAFDFGIIKEGTTQIDWDIKCDVDHDDIPDYVEVGKLGEWLGLQWGGRFTSLKGDLGHLQLDFGFDAYQIKAFYDLGGMERVNQEIQKKIEKGVWV